MPAVYDEINGRGEFLTAYVGESYADHGKWQAFFEYCSLMGELLDKDILSCPLYDGGQAAALTTEKMVDAMMVCGGRRKCVGAVEKMAKGGVTQVVLTFFDDKINRLMEFVTNELTPSFGL